jgi:hypothetical protein
MAELEKKRSPLRRPFVAGGALLGVLLSAWYLFGNWGRATLIPDPIWTRFVNVALIMFVSIYLANLLRVAVEFLLRRKHQR